MVKLVGILNVTPDSFSDGGKFLSLEPAILHADQLFIDGADLIDVGGESTNPRAAALPWQVEWGRLEPILPHLIKKYPGKISLDSYHPETVSKALEYGEIIVNDVSGLHSPAMYNLIVERNLTCIISHLPSYASDASVAHKGTLLSDKNEVIADMNNVFAKLQEAGLPAEKIILDPGIGFGKTRELNHQLLSIASDMPDKTIMIGYSRKRFLGENRFDTATNLKAAELAIESGASYLRVHDIKAHYDYIHNRS